MIWRNLHPICDNCWDREVGTERRKVRDIHHFFTYQRNPECCFCSSPSHGQWLKRNRTETPCHGMFGFHTGQLPLVIDFDALRTKYRSGKHEDKEVIELINVATALKKELELYEQGADQP